MGVAGLPVTACRRARCGLAAQRDFVTPEKKPTVAMTGANRNRRGLRCNLGLTCSVIAASCKEVRINHFNPHICHCTEGSGDYRNRWARYALVYCSTASGTRSRDRDEKRMKPLVQRAPCDDGLLCSLRLRLVACVSQPRSPARVSSSAYETQDSQHC